jgi:hypothetical protein
MMKQHRIIVMGILGRTPVAGVAWQVLHYLEGLRRLGHDVYYVEDTQDWPYNPETGAEDCNFTMSYIDRLMTWCQLGGRWAFVDVSQGGRVYGMSELKLSKIFEGADALINLTGSTRLRDRHMRVPVRVYLETDPGVPQIEAAQGNQFTIDFLKAHTHHFTFGENFGKPECALPMTTFKYRPTRQPIVLDWWQQGFEKRLGEAMVRPSGFTTVSTWQQSNDILWNGEMYTWSKDKQFLKFIELPRRSRESFELALACDDSKSIELLRSEGWGVIDALPLTKDIFPYRNYIADSKGEFTVAKDQYSRLRTGWFSDRSACYLAAGKPVITQDTGFGSVLPSGEGLFAFTSIEDVLTALDTIAADYVGHRRAATEIASEYFAAEKVIGGLMTEMEL